MNPITFPGLGLTFHIQRVAFQIFGKDIYWYGIIIAAGFLLAAAFCSWRARDFGIKKDDFLDMLLWGLPIGIICARIYYVIFYLSLYRDAQGKFQWSEAIAIWDGGLAIYGTVITVVIIALCLSRRKGEKGFKFFAMTDLVVIGLFVGQFVGRWGNFMNREAFGAETTLPWRMRLTTVAGAYIEVHPTFLYESLWNLVGLLLLLFVVSRARRFDGENTWFYFLWYGVGRSWIEGLRTDSLYLFDWTLFGAPIRVSQVLSIAMVFVSLFMLVYNIKIKPHKPEELWVNQVAARKAAQDALADTAAQPAAEPEVPETPESPEEDK